MKLLFDFLPIIIFFTVYKWQGIYVATGVLIVTSVLQTLIYWFKYRKLDGMMLTTAVIALVLGSITIVLKNDMFIKWKPSIIYWLFGLVFLCSQFIGNKTIVERMLEKNIQLPSAVWTRLNYLWVGFFLAMGAINLYVIYHFSTDFWVNFKVIGIIGLTLAFVVAQALYLSRHIEK